MATCTTTSSLIATLTGSDSTSPGFYAIKERIAKFGAVEGSPTAVSAMPSDVEVTSGPTLNAQSYSRDGVTYAAGEVLEFVFTSLSSKHLEQPVAINVTLDTGDKKNTLTVYVKKEMQRDAGECP